MKIGIFIDGGFIPSYDGATNRFQYLSRNLQKIGVDIVIFYCYRGWSDIDLIKKELFKTYILPVDNYYRNLDLIASLIKKENIDIIQFNDMEPILLFGTKLSKITETYLVIEMHYVVSNLAKSLNLSSVNIKNIKGCEKLVGSLVDHLICLSKDDKPILMNNMMISGSRVSVIPSGVDIDDIKFSGPNFDNKTILFLGNLFFEPNAKALRNIYKYIYPKLKNSGFKFLIVGDCPKGIKDKYENHDFKFTGTVKNLNDVFKKSTVALAPILEGTGMRIKILNYLAAGLPVVTTSIAASGFPNKNVLIIEDDLKRYANIIIDIIDKKENTLSLARNSRFLMKKEFNWTTIAEKTKSVYNDILSIAIRDKNLSVEELSKINLNKEPAWLEETRKKGRFAGWPYDFGSNFYYALIENNKININKK